MEDSKPMEAKKLSIIVPVYNAELYLEECVGSILRSDLPKNLYEIILVDDGSKDRSGEIARRFAGENDNIAFLAQENAGQSAARNNGIEHCQGEYVWCVDSDDKTQGSLNAILKVLEKNPSLDILGVILEDVTEQGEVLGLHCTQPTLAHNVTMKGREAIISGYNPSSVCALVVRKSLMTDNNLFFKVGITHQDVELSYRLFAHAGDVMFTHIKPYVYIQHADSTSHSLNPKKKIKYVCDDIVINSSFTALAESVKDSDPELYATIRRRIRNVQFGMVLNLRTNRKTWKPLGISQVVLQNLKEAGLYPLKGDYGSWKKNLAKHILNIESFVC